MITLKQRISKLKNSAKTRNIPVKLMDYEYQNLLDIGCHYCGKNILEENGACLDRIDSNKGYTLYNVVGCCKRCNIAKNDMTFIEFIQWVKSVNSHVDKVLENLSKIEYNYNYKDEKDLHKSLKTSKGLFIKS